MEWLWTPAHNAPGRDINSQQLNTFSDTMATPTLAFQTPPLSVVANGQHALQGLVATKA
jgi:hypothetical protein